RLTNHVLSLLLPPSRRRPAARRQAGTGLALSPSGEGTEQGGLQELHHPSSLRRGRRCTMFGLTPRRRESRAEAELARREPAPLELLRREFAPLFERVFPAWPTLFASPWEMTEPWGLEMEDRAGEVVVRAEVPDFEANELDVRLHDNLLTIRAERREAPEGEAAARRRARLERTVT